MIKIGNPNRKRMFIRRHSGTFLHQAGTSREEYAERTVRHNISTDKPSLTYILEGSGFYREVESGKEIPFHPGCVFLKNPDAPFDQHHDPGLYVDKYIVLPRPVYDFFLEDNNLPLDSILVDIGVDIALCVRFDSMINELRFQPKAQLTATVLRLSAFALELLSTERSSPQGYKDEMEEAVCILESDFSEKLSLEDTAEKLGMSYTNFRRVFRIFYGMSPGEYRNRKKMEYILSFMDHHDVPVKELAERFGYPDAFAFSRQFKKHAGVSPKTLRKTLRGAEKHPRT